MNSLKKQITIVFLGIFILVKINPAYFGAQFPPLAGKPKSAAIAFQAPRQERFLVRIDKGIIESDNLKFTSKIKFSGTLFALIPVGCGVIWIMSSNNFHLLTYSFFETKKYLCQRVLRL